MMRTSPGLVVSAPDKWAATLLKTVFTEFKGARESYRLAAIYDPDCAEDPRVLPGMNPLTRYPPLDTDHFA